MTQPLVREERAATQTSLQTSLRPLIGLTYYCGILPVWSGPKELGSVRSTLLRTAVSMAMGLQLAVVLFQFVQLRIQFAENHSIHSIAFNLLWLAPFLAGLVLHVLYASRAPALCRLFHDWQQIEVDPLPVRSKSRIRWIRGTLYGLALTLTTISTISIVSIMNEQPQASYLLTYYPWFRGPGMYPWTVGFTLLAVLYQKIVRAMSDLVPSLFYYHVSFTAQNLILRIESLTFWTVVDAERPKVFQPQLQSIRSDYNRLRKCVARANELFGPVMICGQSLKFGLIVLLTFKMVYGLANSSPFVPYLVNLMFVSYELMSSVLLISRLKDTVGVLRGAYADFVVDLWPSLTADEKAAAVAFSDELQEERLAVRPSNFYTVQPELLLAMLGLVTTYTIILLQSK